MTIKVKHSASKIKYPNPKRAPRKFRNPYRFYVYMWLRSKDSITGKAGTPYYVGKGQTSRAYRKEGPIDKSNVVIVESNMLEQDSFDLEIKLILQYGRVDLGTGILRNLTSGGEGGSGKVWSIEEKLKVSGENNGMYGKSHTEENKKIISAAQTGEKHHMYGKKQSPETNEKNRIAQTGKKHSPEHVEKNRIAHIGRKVSVDTRQKLSIAHKGVPKSEEHKIKLRVPKSEEHKIKLRVPKRTVMCDCCGTVGGISIMKLWHFENCKYRQDIIMDLMSDMKQKYETKINKGLKDKKLKDKLIRIQSIIDFQLQQNSNP